METRDRHHVVFGRQEWSGRPESKAIRSTPSLLVTMDREAHNELHRDCPAVPLLGYHALRRVLNTFEPQRDTMRTIESLMSSIEQAADDPRSHIVERRLAELAVWSIDLQRPYVQEQLNVTRRLTTDFGPS